MNLLVDIGHPAHVHYFKNLARHFISEGHQVLFTYRNKDVVSELVKSYGFNYKCIGYPFKNAIGKLFGLIIFNYRLLRISFSFKPDIFLSAGSIYAAHTAWLLGRHHITLEDTGNMEQIRFYSPFTKAILTPASFHKDLGKKHIRLQCYNELAYLHPSRFSPDEDIKTLIGLKASERFVLLRFVSWDATHDLGNKGISDKIKRKLIDIISNYYKVFISSENKLPEDLVKYKIKIPATKMHDVLYAAELYIGEGATMASECAMLGTPAIYLNPLNAGTINDQEKFGVLIHFKTDQGLIEKVEELIKIPDLKDHFRLVRDKMLSDKIDLTAFLIWFVQNWPESFRIMKDDPVYQERFK